MEAWQQGIIRSIDEQQMREHMPAYSKRMDEEGFWKSVEHPWFTGRQLGFLGFEDIARKDQSAIYWNPSIEPWLKQNFGVGEDLGGRLEVDFGDC